MEGMFTFVGIIMIVFGILQIILFFKIWGMTNNVSEIKNIIRNNIKETKTSTPNVKSGSNINVGDLVVELKNERQLKVIDITNNGEFECSTPGGIHSVGIFKRNEIEKFDKYWNKSK